MRPPTRALITLAYVPAVLPAAPAWATAVPQSLSLCITAEDGCDVAGATVHLYVQLGQSASVIVGGDLEFDYDPALLGFIEVLPGRACDPASPFSVGIVEVIDEQNGTIHYSVGTAIGDSGTQGPATMACLTFLVREGATGTTDVCLSDGMFATVLVDEFGNSVPIDNSMNCPPDRPPPAITCAPVEIDTGCQCAEGLPDCSFWDDDCNVGVCNEGAARCEAVPANEGGACNDGIACTLTDLCVNGTCVGTDCSDPSLCIMADEACAGLGEATVRVELGKGEPVIVGGQFSIQYDPTVLDFVSIEPGSTCDSTSPFELEIFESVDEVNGVVFYAVGILPVFYAGGPGTVISGLGSQGPTTMACLRFAITKALKSQVCLFSDEKPMSAILVDQFGQARFIFNGEDCPPKLPPPVLSCDDLVVDEQCPCVLDPDSCRELDSFCRVGVCNEQTGECEGLPINEGLACDDGDPCTSFDTCTDGECVGSGCQQPSLCVVADDQCFTPGSKAEVAIRLGQGSSMVVGAQFSIQYDPAALDLVSIEPGSTCDPASPFSLEIFETADEATGDAFYAVGATLGGAGTQGPATMACLSFIVLGPLSNPVCLINNLNPFSTIVVAEGGGAVTIDNTQDCPTAQPLPVMSCDEICVFVPPVPTVAGWGTVHMTLLLLAIAKVCFGRRFQPPPPVRRLAGG